MAHIRDGDGFDVTVCGLVAGGVPRFRFRRRDGKDDAWRPPEPARPVSGPGSQLRALDAVGAGHAVTALLARYPAGQASPPDVAQLLQALRAAGAGHAVTALLARDPAGQASLDNPPDVIWLLRALGWAGASDAVRRSPDAAVFVGAHRRAEAVLVSVETVRGAAGGRGAAARGRGGAGVGASRGAGTRRGGPGAVRRGGGRAAVRR